MINQPKSNFDLEKRTTDFGIKVVRLCRTIEKDSINNGITGQLVGSAGSVGANYREANDNLGKKDFLQKLRISRKEAKEAIHWLALLQEGNGPDLYSEIDDCIREATELKNILSTIIAKCE